MNKIEEVYSIFQDFFGEDLVDLQNDTILVLFPRTTITNESGDSTEIGKLFAKVKLSSSGRIIGSFQLLRTEFSESHFRCGYIHSHVPRLGVGSDLDEFRNPCLGYGPIKETCVTLNVAFDADMWRLFCYELSKYVTVESLSGGPYFRIRDIGHCDIFSDNYSSPWILVNYIYPVMSTFRSEYDGILPEFTSYVLSKGEIPFNYENDHYSVAMSPYDLTVTLSNMFIEWYNTLPDGKKPEDRTRCYKHQLYFEGKCCNGRLYKKNLDYRRSSHSIASYIGTPLVTFKGVVYTLEIPDFVAEPEDKIEDEYTSILIHPNLATDVINRLIKIINYGYRKPRENRSEDGSYSTYIGEDSEILF